MNEVLKLCNFPKKSLMKKRIPIKSIVDSYKLKKNDENLLRSQIKSIDLVAVLDSDSTFLYLKELDGFKFEQIFVLSIELKTISKNIRLDKKVQSYFQNPTIIIYNINSKYKLSSADKRVNLNDKNQSVITGMFSSNFFDIESKELIEMKISLDYSKREFKDLLDLYSYYQNVIFNELLTRITGTYPKKVYDAKYIKDSLNELDILKQELNMINEEEKTTISLNDKMELNKSKIEIIEKQNEIRLRFMEVS